jgi:hypothetical protein
MDKSKEIYLIIADNHDPTLEFGEAIRATTAVATNFKKAYELALSMGEIKVPSLGYRSALERTNRDLAFQLEDKVGPSLVTIALIKKW